MSPEMLYIYTVYHEGSFSKAAEKLYMTQPAISIAVHKVEESLGMPIFDRGSRPIQLTEAGRIYLETINKMLLLEKEQQQKINDIQNIVTGHIRIGGTHYFNAYILPNVYAEFNRRYPQAVLEIMERSSFELVQMLAARELDLTFSCSESHLQEFLHYKMFEDHILLAVPEEDPFNQQHAEMSLSATDILQGRHIHPECPKLNLSSLAELDLILLRKGNNLHDRTQKMFDTAGITPKVKMELNQLVTAFHLAEAGIGATFISDRVILKDKASLLFYALESSLATRTFYILLPKNTYIPIAVRKMVEFIQSSMAQNPQEAHK